VRTAQVYSETLLEEIVVAKTAQVYSETLLSGSYVSIAQVYSETLLQDATVMVMPTPYPTLPGLSFSVMKRPVGGSTGVAKAASGREIRVQYYTFPEWEWDLTYEYLPDFQGNGATTSDLRDLMGFCLSVYGSFFAFPFQDPADYFIQGYDIAGAPYTNGVNTTFLLLKDYGLYPFVGVEPIGWLNTSPTAIPGLSGSNPINVYINGTLQSPSTYTLSLASPYNQLIVFNTPPASGVVISVDMQYYFMTRLKMDTTEFEEFLHNFWSLKKITLVSLKGT
jgi:hypothetical protein